MHGCIRLPCRYRLCRHPSSQAAGSATGVHPDSGRHSTTVHGYRPRRHWNPEWTRIRLPDRTRLLCTKSIIAFEGISRHAFPFTATFGSIAQVSIFTDQPFPLCRHRLRKFLPWCRGHRPRKWSPQAQTYTPLPDRTRRWCRHFRHCTRADLRSIDPGRMHRLRCTNCHRRKSLRWEEGASGFGIAGVIGAEVVVVALYRGFRKAGSRLARLFLRAKVPIFARVPSVTSICWHSPVSSSSRQGHTGIVVFFADDGFTGAGTVLACVREGAIVAIRTRGSIREGCESASFSRSAVIQGAGVVVLALNGLSIAFPFGIAPVSVRTGISVIAFGVGFQGCIPAFAGLGVSFVEGAGFPSSHSEASAQDLFAPPSVSAISPSCSIGLAGLTAASSEHPHALNQTPHQTDPTGCLSHCVPHFRTRFALHREIIGLASSGAVKNLLWFGGLWTGARARLSGSGKY